MRPAFLAVSSSQIPRMAAVEDDKDISIRIVNVTFCRKPNDLSFVRAFKWFPWYTLSDQSI